MKAYKYSKPHKGLVKRNLYIKFREIASSLYIKLLKVVSVVVKLFACRKIAYKSS